MSKSLPRCLVREGQIQRRADIWPDVVRPSAELHRDEGSRQWTASRKYLGHNACPILLCEAHPWTASLSFSLKAIQSEKSEAVVDTPVRPTLTRSSQSLHRDGRPTLWVPNGSRAASLQRVAGGSSSTSSTTASGTVRRSSGPHQKLTFEERENASRESNIIFASVHSPSKKNFPTTASWRA